MGGIEARDSCFLFAVGTYSIKPLVDTCRPRHHLIIGYLRIEQLGRKGSLIVLLVICPVLWRIFYRVGQEEHLASGRSGHRLHATVFQESRFEHTFLACSIEVVRYTRGTCPYLGYVTVAILHRSERCFRRYNVPHGVVYQGVGRHVASDVHAFLLAIFLGIGEGLIQRSIIQMVFQLVGEVSILCRKMLCSPRKAIIFLPFAFERIAVSGVCPELRFFQEDFTDTGIDYRLDLSFLEVFQIVQGRDNVRSSRIVQNGVTLCILLSFIHVRFSVPLSGEVVAVSTPGNTRHEVGSISTLLPALHSVLESHFRSASGAIYHHCVRADIDGRLPMAGRLEGSLYFLSHARK